MGVDEIMGQDTPPDAIVDLVRNMVARAGRRVLRWRTGASRPRYDESLPPAAGPAALVPRAGDDGPARSATRRSSSGCARCAPTPTRTRRSTARKLGRLRAPATSRRFEDFERAAGDHARTSCAPTRPSTRRSAPTPASTRPTSSACTARAARPGRPTAFGIGADDWRAIANAHARIMWGMGIRPADTVFIGSRLQPLHGLVGDAAPAPSASAPPRSRSAPAWPARAQRAVNWMAQMKPAAFYGTPSYALRLAEIAAEEGIDPRDFGIRILFFSGEPGASIPTIRAPHRGALRRQGVRLRLDGGDDAVDEPRRVLAPRPGCCAGRTSSTPRCATPRRHRRAAVRQRGHAGLHAPRAHQPADDPAAVRRPHALGVRARARAGAPIRSSRAASTAASTTCSRSAARTSTRRRSTRSLTALRRATAASTAS